VFKSNHPSIITHFAFCNKKMASSPNITAHYPTEYYRAVESSLIVQSVFQDTALRAYIALA